MLFRLLTLAVLLTSTAPAVASATPTAAPDRAETLYESLGLDGAIDRAAFLAGIRSAEARSLDPTTFAIADMSRPSSERRLVIVDLVAEELVLQTFVAHGSGSGGLMAEQFSNIEGSHQTSLGLYRVGSEIVSPKHGPALLLDGLDPGINDLARPREIIIHGADYVSAEFVAANGRLGRSWGCPAVPRNDMAQVIDLLADDGLLFIYGE